MAKQTVNLGTAANDGTGDPLRTAFQRVNENFDEVYGNNFVTNAMLGANVVTAAKINNGTITLAKLGVNSVNGDKIVDDAIDSEHYATGSIDTEHIADDQITHAKLEGRYTAVQSISNTADATQNLDASSYSVFNFTADRIKDTTLNIQNMKTGQVIDIIGLSGSYTITLQSDDTSETFNKVGGVDYDGAEDNHLQILCVDDTDSAAIYNYAIGTYTSDTTA